MSFTIILLLISSIVQAMALVKFDPKAQFVSTSGDHAFVPPDFAAGDQRGPCPGLNAMANHNYIPHNGVATIEQFAIACYKVIGLGLDVSTFLATYGAIFDGNLREFSISGPTDLVRALTYVPKGLRDSHNNYESDTSPMKGDLYQYGNAYKVVLSQFEYFYRRLSERNGIDDLSTIFEFRNHRINESISNNPYYFCATFACNVIVAGSYTFMYRLMANRSEEHPTGLLTGDVLKAWYSVTEENGKFVYKEGYERIPDNWYRRAFGDEYTIPFFATDVLTGGLMNPAFFSLGGNLGKTNSFTGISPENLTGGVYNLQNLGQGNNAFCFFFQLLLQASPHFIEAAGLELIQATNILGGLFNDYTSGLNCPQLTRFDPIAVQLEYMKYPGWRKSIGLN